MYPDFIKKIVAGGNSIGLHGVSHSESIYQSETSPLNEMEKANLALKEVTGKRSRLVRVPFGSYYRLSDKQAKLLEENGYLIWDWNVDPRDSVGYIEKERVLRNLRRDLKKCSTAPVILFHDRKSTLNLMEDVLSYLKEEGFTLLPLSEKQTPLNQLK
jgi:peptidoglycan/xylan/chitin deacetylase (PgdA/CDA1 family)